MRSWLVSALSSKVTRGAGRESLDGLSRGDWLVWEPSTWHPARANSATAMGLPMVLKGASGQAPRVAEALAIALEPKVPRADVTFGRERCDVTIDDRTLSQHHLGFSFDEHHWWVRDVGSRNGTLVDGRKLGAEPVMMVAGMVIQPAQVVLTYYTTPALLVRLASSAPRRPTHA